MREEPRGGGQDVELRRQARKASLKFAVPDWIRNGRRLSDLQVSTTAVWFPHGLERVPSGWILMGIDSNQTVWQTGSNSKAIQLDASGAAVISIWIF